MRNWIIVILTVSFVLGPIAQAAAACCAQHAGGHSAEMEIAPDNHTAEHCGSHAGDEMVSGSEAGKLFGVHLDGTPCSNMSSCTTGVMATAVGDIAAAPVQIIAFAKIPAVIGKPLDRADELTHPPSIT